MNALTSGALLNEYGVTIDASMKLADDPKADGLDALLCAVQAAWAWRQREHQFGMPADCDPLEGWIADPATAPGYR